MAIEELDLSGQGERSVFALVAGRAGVGKTSLASNFPIDDFVYVSAEKGELSLQGSKIKALKVSTQQDAMDLIALIPTWPQRYWLFDSLSEFYDQVRDGARDRFTVQQNFAKNDEIKYWMIWFIKALRDIVGKDIFLLCHTKDEKNGPIIEQELCFDGKTPSEIKKQFDLVIHMDQDDDENRFFVTSPAKSKIAKIRKSPWLDVQVEDIEEPDLYKLAEKLKGRK